MPSSICNWFHCPGSRYLLDRTITHIWWDWTIGVETDYTHITYLNIYHWRHFLQCVDTLHPNSFDAISFLIVLWESAKRIIINMKEKEEEKANYTERVKNCIVMLFCTHAHTHTHTHNITHTLSISHTRKHTVIQHCVIADIDYSLLNSWLQWMSRLLFRSNSYKIGSFKATLMIAILSLKSTVFLCF